MLKGGGYGVVPFPPKRKLTADTLLPTYSIMPWPYADLSLPWWDLHREFAGIVPASADAPQKVGFTDYSGWSAYWSRGTVFVKFASAVSRGVYPDRGCRLETYTDGQVIELETLGPLVSLNPGKRATHVEYWGVLDGLARPSSDQTFATALVPAVRAWLRRFKP